MRNCILLINIPLYIILSCFSLAAQNILNDEQLNEIVESYNDLSIDNDNKQIALENIISHYSAVQPDSMLI